MEHAFPFGTSTPEKQNYLFRRKFSGVKTQKVPFTFPLDFPETFWKQAVLLQVAVYYKSWLSNADLRWTLSFFLLPGNQAFNKSLKKTKLVTLLLSKCKEGTNARSLQQSQRVFASFGKLKLNKCIFASDIFLSSFQVFMVFSNYILPQKPVAQTPSLLFCKSCFDAHTILARAKSETPVNKFIIWIKQ